MAQALPSVADAFEASARSRAAEGDLDGAARRWEQVIELDPERTSAWCALGDVLARAGRMDEAHRAWRQGPFHPDCAAAQGEAWLAEHPEWALQRFQVYATVSSQEPRAELLLARAYARLDPERGAAALRRYMERGGDDLDGLAVAVREVADALPAPEGVSLLRAVGERAPSLRERLAAPLLELEVGVRVEQLLGAGPTPLDATQRVALRDARAALAAGEVGAAVQAMEQLTDQVARSPDLWAALADAREAAGDVAGAERALGLATQLAPLEPRHHARLAELLATHYAGRFDAEAVDALERAIALGGAGLRRRHAELALRAGRTDAARRSLEVLRADGDGASQAWAIAQLDALDRERPSPAELPAVPPPPHAPIEAWRALHRSRVFHELARAADTPEVAAALRARAEQAIDTALALAPRFVEALELRARLHREAGRDDAAIADLRASLEAAPERADALELLASLLERRADPDADAAWARAAQAGSGAALYRLARRDARAGRLWSASERLEAYVRVSSSGPERPAAMALRRRLAYARGAVWAAAGLALLGVFSAPLLIGWWRRRGIGLRELVRRHPALRAEVSAHLGAIRHEVIKHHISALPALGEGPRRDAAEDASWVEARLTGPEGALARFEAAVAALVALGARAGERVNLRHADPDLGPLLRDIDALRRALRSGRSDATAKARACAERINTLHYRRLGELLDGLCTLTLDEGFVERAWAAVRAEHPTAALTLRVEVERGLRVRMPADELHTVLVNLLRNALEASVAEGRGGLGVRVRADDDFVTGLAWAELRVADQVSQPLTTAMIRGRYVDRGLGLAVALTVNAGGSVQVADEPGWSKAVVVRLPLVEEGA